jgi:hypothetical protein
MSDNSKFYGIYIEMESTYDPSEWRDSDGVCAGLKALPGCVEATKHPTKPTTVVSVHELSDLEKGSIGGLPLTGKVKLNEVAIELPLLKSGQRYILRELE